LFAKTVRYHDDVGAICQQQQKERAQVDAPVAAAQWVAFDDTETFDEPDHDLRAGGSVPPNPSRNHFQGCSPLRTKYWVTTSSLPAEE